jgi:hypothetical protein
MRRRIRKVLMPCFLYLALSPGLSTSICFGFESRLYPFGNDGTVEREQFTAIRNVWNRCDEMIWYLDSDKFGSCFHNKGPVGFTCRKNRDESEQFTKLEVFLMLKDAAVKDVLLIMLANKLNSSVDSDIRVGNDLALFAKSVGYKRVLVLRDIYNPRGIFVLKDTQEDSSDSVKPKVPQVK